MTISNEELVYGDSKYIGCVPRQRYLLNILNSADEWSRRQSQTINDLSNLALKEGAYWEEMLLP